MNISIKSAVTAIFLPLMFLQSSGKEIFVSPGGILPPFRSQSGVEIAILQRFPVRVPQQQHTFTGVLRKRGDIFERDDFFIDIDHSRHKFFLFSNYLPLHIPPKW